MSVIGNESKEEVMAFKKAQVTLKPELKSLT